MTPSSVALDLEQLGEAAPMLVAFDRTLTIRYLGRAWRNADPDARPGQPLGSRVRIVRPNTPFDFDELIRRASSSSFLEVLATGLPLRGQFLRAADDVLVFFGRPWITSGADLTKYRTSLADLSMSDRDFLFVLHTKDLVIAESAWLSEQLSAQRAEQRRTVQTLSAQFAITRVLAEARNLEEAAAGIVKALCDVAGWSCGAVWRVDRRDAQTLRCVDTWTRPGTAPGFAEVTRAAQFPRGSGLLDPVWASGKSVWIGDVTQDPTFVRAAAAAAAGLRGAFALPIVTGAGTSGGGQQVVGVVEIFGAETRQPEPQVLEVIESLRSQIGQFLDRRSSEESLRLSEESTRMIIDSALDAVVTIDAAGRVNAWNAQAERTFGWSAAEAVGQNLATLIMPPAVRDAHRRGLARYQQTRRSDTLGRRLEMTAVDRHGREFPVELSISPVHRSRGRDGEAPSGPPILYSGFIRDITARRESEEALRRAKEAAEAAAAAKSEFLATMSHEIRTPMNSVIGLTGLLLDTPLSEGQRAFAETVLNAGESLLTIINDILDFSKVEAGQMALEQLAFAPADIVQDVVELLEPAARQRGLRLVAEVDASVPAAVLADPGRVRQVLTNLVGNAVKFTERGEIRIVADVAGGDAAAPHLRFRVIDTGVGIAPDVLPRLFKPFSQADSSMSRRYGGTGLGLAISDRITRLMGGAINAESTVGAGSCFTVTLPMARADASALERAVGDRAPHAPQAPAELGHVRALVVEDNPANQMVVLAMLKRLGMRADHVGDGVEALEAVARVPYDVVLMDCQMPRMDGYTAARHIRDSEPAGRRLPIIAMTANAFAGERERCLSAGMDDYLAKPIRIAELAEMLSRWVAPFSDVPAPVPVRDLPPSGALLERLHVVREAMGNAWGDACVMFINHSSALLDQMAVAVDVGDWPELQRLAHSLRGGCEMMGVRGCGELAATIERSIAAGTTLPWQTRLDELRLEFRRAADVMRQLHEESK